MNVDVSQLLVVLARRAEALQERLQNAMKNGHDQIGRALNRPGGFTPHGRDRDAESVAWLMDAQLDRARLDEVQGMIEILTARVGEAAMAGRTDA